MRLFIAADLDAGARAAVAAAVTHVRDEAERQRPGSTRAVAWVEARNLHLTLHFLGEVDEARLPALREALAPAIALDAPRIGLAGWGVFPPHGPARVIWIGIMEGAGTLASAHAVLGDRLRAAGLTPESRPFAAHLTVGRVKVPLGFQWGRLAAAAPSSPVAEWPLRACTLFQSHLSPAGPTYRALLNIPFIGGSGHEAAGVAEARRGE
jgi:2'-5' RNA ligase